MSNKCHILLFIKYYKLFIIINQFKLPATILTAQFTRNRSMRQIIGLVIILAYSSLVDCNYGKSSYNYRSYKQTRKYQKYDNKNRWAQTKYQQTQTKQPSSYYQNKKHQQVPPQQPKSNNKKLQPQKLHPQQVPQKQRSISYSNKHKPVYQTQQNGKTIEQIPISTINLNKKPTILPSITSPITSASDLATVVNDILKQTSTDINNATPLKPIQLVIQRQQIIPTSTATQTPAPQCICQQKPIYDYNLLILTWVPESCYGDKDCEKDWQTQDDLRSPTIHAFRPYSSSSYYQNCFEQSSDPSCRVNGYLQDFQIYQALWNVSGLLYQVSQYWPAQKFSHQQQQFYAHQWSMHGSCYLMNMIQDNPNAYKNDKQAFNRTIMIEYFRAAINKFKKLAINVNPGQEYMYKEQFAEDIGFKGKETHFMITCDKNNEIVEVTFCFNRSKLPGKEVTIPCTMDDKCDENRNFRLKRPL